MIYAPRIKTLGFTLVELAVVLAVTGVLFLGLYRLLSSGNAQVKDTSAAGTQTQVINAVKGFLASTSGANWMGAKVGATGSNSIPSTDIVLPLPPFASRPDGGTNTNCHTYMDGLDFPAGNTNLRAFCEFLPAGFSTSTLNSYGQDFTNNVLVQTGPINNTLSPPTYSFMIVTNNGDTIPDADGGRISSAIGSEGGFIYSSAVCTGAASNITACGAYGAWTAATTGAAPGGYNLLPVGNSKFGRIASRTYVSLQTNTSLPWLARLPFGIDQASTTPSPGYATMQWDLYMGAHSGTGVPTNIWMAGNQGTTGGGTLNLQGAVISDMSVPTVNAHSLQISVPGPYGYGVAGAHYITGSAMVYLNSDCSVDDKTAQPANANVFHIPGDVVNSAASKCKPALLINGDVTDNGLLQATSLYSGTFIYQASDQRLKKDIKPIPHALDDLMKIKPVSFALKSSGQKSLGFIAQEMEKVYPELVTQNGDQAMKAVNYDGLIAPLVAAVQELKQQNDDLRQQLVDQENRQKELQQKLEDKKK